MYPYRLSGKRLFIPGFGILPYVRGLRMAKRKGVYSFLVVHGGETWAYGCYSGNYAETVMSALRKLEELAGALYTGMILRTNERSTKKNPTGYAGIYKLDATKGLSPERLRRNAGLLDLACQPALGNWTGEQISTR